MRNSLQQTVSLIRQYNLDNRQAETAYKIVCSINQSIKG